VELVGINCRLRAYRFFFWINDANDELDFLGDFIALTFAQYYLMAEWKQVDTVCCVWFNNFDAYQWRIRRILIIPSSSTIIRQSMRRRISMKC
jgi:hypothetical protein